MGKQAALVPYFLRSEILATVYLLLRQINDPLWEGVGQFAGWKPKEDLKTPVYVTIVTFNAFRARVVQASCNPSSTPPIVLSERAVFSLGDMADGVQQYDINIAQDVLRWILCPEDPPSSGISAPGVTDPDIKDHKSRPTSAGSSADSAEHPKTGDNEKDKNLPGHKGLSSPASKGQCDSQRLPKPVDKEHGGGKTTEPTKRSASDSSNESNESKTSATSAVDQGSDTSDTLTVPDDADHPDVPGHETSGEANVCANNGE